MGHELRVHIVMSLHFYVITDCNTTYKNRYICIYIYIYIYMNHKLSQCLVITCGFHENPGATYVDKVGIIITPGFHWIRQNIHSMQLQVSSLPREAIHPTGLSTALSGLPQRTGLMTRTLGLEGINGQSWDYGQIISKNQVSFRNNIIC